MIVMSGFFEEISPRSEGEVADLKGISIFFETNQPFHVTNLAKILAFSQVKKQATALDFSHVKNLARILASHVREKEWEEL